MNKKDIAIVKNLIHEHLEKPKPVAPHDETELLRLLALTDDLSMSNCLRIAHENGINITKRQMKTIRDEAIVAVIRREQAEFLIYLEDFARNHAASRENTSIERTIPIACTTQEYQTILTQTDPRMRTQLIITGLGLLDTISMAREGKDKPEVSPHV